jgi:hypothetical protein
MTGLWDVKRKGFLSLPSHYIYSFTTPNDQHFNPKLFFVNTPLQIIINNMKEEDSGPYVTLIL